MKQLVAALVGLVAALVTASLGFWQLSRLEERRAQNAVMETMLQQPPIDLLDAPGGSSLAFRRTIVHGVFDFDHQIVLMVRSRQGVPGVHVVTPLRLSDGTGVLVERGFVPSPDARRIDLDKVREPDSAVVTGYLLSVTDESPSPSEASWPVYLLRADPERLQERYSYRLHPYLLRRTIDPPVPPAMLDVLEPPARTDGPHLSYAIQWFSFAVIAVIGTVALIAKSRNDATGPEG